MCHDDTSAYCINGSALSGLSFQIPPDMTCVCWNFELQAFHEWSIVGWKSGKVFSVGRLQQDRRVDPVVSLARSNELG